jgi:hypothetical protein
MVILSTVGNKRGPVRHGSARPAGSERRRESDEAAIALGAVGINRNTSGRPEVVENSCTVVYSAKGESIASEKGDIRFACALGHLP